MAYLARAVRGIEDVAAAELTERFAATIERVEHREIVFTSAVPPVGLLDARTVDDVFVLGAEIDGVGRHRSALDRLTGLDGDALRSTIDVVASVRAVSAIDDFVVTGSFLGKRNYNRFELEDAVGSTIAAATGGHYVGRDGDGRQPPTLLSWRIHVRDERAILGLRLAPGPLHRRDYKTSTTPGTLHPPVAAAMVRVGDVGPGDTVLDPFCGSGTIVAEAALGAPGATALGFDLDSEAVTIATANVSSLAPIATADARRLPLPDHSFDAVITNPPWDRTVSFAGTWAAIWDELARVLRPRGRIVVLSELDLGPPPTGFTHDDLGPLSIMGAHPRLHVFRGQ